MFDIVNWIIEDRWPNLPVGVQVMTLNPVAVWEDSSKELSKTFYLEHFPPSFLHRLSSLHPSFYVRSFLPILPNWDVLWGPFPCPSSSSEECPPAPPPIAVLWSRQALSFLFTASFPVPRRGSGLSEGRNKYLGRSEHWRHFLLIHRVNCSL